MLPVGVLIRDRPEPHLLDAELTVKEAASFLRDHRIGGAPVLQYGRMVGFLSERDIVFRVVAEGLDPSATKVAQVMSQPLTTASVDETIQECEQRMRRMHVRHLPILENRKLVGCLSLRDLLQSELRQAETEVRSLSEYIRGTPRD